METLSRVLKYHDRHRTGNMQESDTDVLMHETRGPLHKTYDDMSDFHHLPTIVIRYAINVSQRPSQHQALVGPPPVASWQGASSR